MPILDLGQPNVESIGGGVCTSWAHRSDVAFDWAAQGVDGALLDEALLVASSMLYNMTLQQWPGLCRSTVRPCSRYETPDTMRTNTMRNVRGVNVIDGGLSWRCSCRAHDVYQPGCFYLSQIGLGESPLTSIVQVKIDGEVVPSDRYRVDDYRWLVYLPDPTGVDERQGWPCCQRMDLEPSELGTFEVTFTVGGVPDRGGVRAAARLGSELAKLWTPALASSCQLNGRVTSMTRQQVTMTVSDPSALLDKGLTGLVDVDLWVQGVLRAHRTRRAAIVVPERRRQVVRRRTS